MTASLGRVPKPRGHGDLPYHPGTRPLAYKVITMPSSAALHPTIWFEDGNIVLHGEGVLFKVFRGILCKYSDVFADMLSLSQPSPPEEDLYDDCPLVKLGDSAAALEAFLSAMFDCEYVDTIRGKPILATLLGIAHKYNAPSIWRRAISVLQYDFPDTAEGYMNICKAAHLADRTEAFVRFDWDLHTSVLKEAQKANAQVLLPAASLRIMGQSFSSILSNILLPNADDLVATITRRDDVAELSRKHLFASVPREHTSEHCCLMPWYYLRKEVYATKTFLNPFDVLLQYQKRYPNTFDQCLSCRRPGASPSCKKAMEGFWEGLPGVLGLPAWKKLREAAHGST